MHGVNKLLMNKVHNIQFLIANSFESMKSYFLMYIYIFIWIEIDSRANGYISLKENNDKYT
jgi:hypothetical protein